MEFLVQVSQIAVPIVGIVVAVWAATAWYRNLQSQSADNCISAIYELRGMVNRCLAIKEGKQDRFWRAYEAAWDSWRRFHQTYRVACRYRSSLDNNLPEEAAKLVLQLQELYKKEEGSKAQEINQTINTMAEQLEQKLKRKWWYCQ